MSMTTLKKISGSVKKNFVFYILGLIFNPERKNCTKMAKVLNRSHDSLYRFLIRRNFFAPLFSSFFIKMANYFAKQNSGFLIIDDSALSKTFAKCIERIAWIYNSSLGRPDRGFCIVVVAWSNGKVTIPISFKWWFSKKVIGSDVYQTKTQHACGLIDQVGLWVKFDFILFDGLYFSKDMARFLNDRSIKFITRCASNRNIETADGVRAQVKIHPKLQLSRNNHSKKILASYGDQKLYFIVQKRKNKNNEYEIVFLASNMNLAASEYIKTYSLRWNIEPIFRTSKSYLGIGHCSARRLDKQELHVFAVFFAYSFLQFEKKRLNLECPEQALNHLRQLKPRSAIKLLTAFYQRFELFA